MAPEPAVYHLLRVGLRCSGGGTAAAAMAAMRATPGLTPTLLLLLLHILLITMGLGTGWASDLRVEHYGTNLLWAEI